MPIENGISMHAESPDHDLGMFMMSADVSIAGLVHYIG